VSVKITQFNQNYNIILSATIPFLTGTSVSIIAFIHFLRITQCNNMISYFLLHGKGKYDELCEHLLVSPLCLARKKFEILNADITMGWKFQEKSNPITSYPLSISRACMTSSSRWLQICWTNQNSNYMGHRLKCHQI
jgi:hypothetical protein